MRGCVSPFLFPPSRHLFILLACCIWIDDSPLFFYFQSSSLSSSLPMYYREEMGNRDGDTCKIQMKTKQNKLHPVTFHLLGHIVEQRARIWNTFLILF